VAAEEEGQKAKQMEENSDHRAAILAGSGPTDQPLVARPEYWRGTGWRADRVEPVAETPRPGSARSARASRPRAAP
jgi:hypothetical protein